MSDLRKSSRIEAKKNHIYQGVKPKIVSVKQPVLAKNKKKNFKNTSNASILSFDNSLLVSTSLNMASHRASEENISLISPISIPPIFPISDTEK